MSDTFTGHQSFSAEDVSLRRASRMVLSQIRLRLESGELVSLLGANGAGKSSLLSVLSHDLRLDAADGTRPSITLNGHALAALGASEQARRRAVLSQKPELAFDLSVSEVIGIGAYPFPELSEREVRELVDAVIDRTGLGDLADRRYPHLSGGEQQRVQFARVALQALAARGRDAEARYLLMDEPTANLDPLHQRELLCTAASFARRERMGVLVVLHDVNLAACWCDRIVLLAEGRIVACGTPTEVLTTGNMQRVYGVRAEIMPHPRRRGRPLVVFD